MDHAVSVDIRLAGSTLTATIAAASPGSSTYYFYLMRNGRVVSRHGWFKDPAFTWQLTEPAFYKVRGFVLTGSDKRSAFSPSLPFADAATVASWERFRSEPPPEPSPLFSLPYVPLDHPHSDFAVVSGREVPRDCLPPGFVVAATDLGSRINVVHRSGLPQPANGPFVFSGNCYHEDRLVFGQEDALDFEPGALREHRGDFTMVARTSDGLVVTNDWFGVQKLYIYETEDLSIVSNRYHLLLILMRGLSVPMAIDPLIAAALIASGDVQPYQQVFSGDLAVAGVKLLSIEEDIVVSANGLFRRPKEISAVLRGPKPPISAEAYRERLVRGAEELLRNAGALIRHPGFEHILVDVTGGMDTRTVVGAVTHFPEHRHRITVNARNTSTIPNDIRVACGIASHFGFTFESIAEERRCTSVVDNLRRHYSRLLGVYFAYGTPNAGSYRTRRPGTVNVTGFFGEICLRPYYSRYYLDTAVGLAEDVDTFFERLAEENHAWFGTAGALEALRKVFVSSLSRLPGDAPIEKFDLHYLFFRNGLHCSDLYRHTDDTPRVSALPSKTLFELKLATYGKLPQTRLQNDVIACLDPVLTAFPYADQRDNDGLEAVRSDLLFVPDEMRSLRLPAAANGEMADAARARRAVVVVGAPAANEPKAHDLVRTAAFQALHGLIFDFGVIDEAFGWHVFVRLSAGGDDRIIFNKLIMLYLQAALCSGAGAGRD